MINKKKIAGEKAAEYIKEGMLVGLDTGSTAKYLAAKVGELVKLNDTPFLTGLSPTHLNLSFHTFQIFSALS